MLTMQAGTSGAVAVVDVTGVIGWDDAQCLEFADKLKAAANQGASSITLRVNSPGGDVFSALSMYDAIRSCKMPVRAEVHGLAASAASLLCMAAGWMAGAVLSGRKTGIPAWVKRHGTGGGRARLVNRRGKWEIIITNSTAYHPSMNFIINQLLDEVVKAKIRKRDEKVKSWLLKKAQRTMRG